MTKSEKEYLNNLETCFEQLHSAYEGTQNEIKDLNVKIDTLKKVCRKNTIKIPELEESISF